MATRTLSNTKAPGRRSPEFSNARNPQDADIYIHPHLVESYDPCKGRQLQLSAPVPAGTVLMRDVPYAMVPTLEEAQSMESLVCSNLLCRQRVPQAQGSRCPQSCAPEVIWCTEMCKVADQARHDFECAWLKQTAEIIRKVEGENELAMLWLVVRLLAGRHLETRNDPLNQQQYPWEATFKRGWDSVDALRGKEGMWAQEKLQDFMRLVQTYLCNDATLGQIPSAPELITLICQEEMNSFWLCPVDMTMYPPPNPLPEPGLAYGMAIYPRAAMVNHSCLPNITHSPDSQGRMVYTAYRDIAAGEECLISYINLTTNVQLWERQRTLQDLFQFECLCERCAKEQAILLA